MSQYYVYIYLDPRKPGNFNYGEYHFDFEPFYVGMGREKRYLDHLIEAQRIIIYGAKNRGNNLKRYKIINLLKNNFYPVILKLKENLPKEEAEILEIQLIKEIGRFIYKNGPLTNIANGGNCGIGTKGERNAMFGLKGKNHPASKWVRPKEYREKMKISKSGSKNAMFGKKWTEEHRISHSLKIRNAYKNKSEEEKNIFKNKLKIVRKNIIIDVNGEKNPNAKEWIIKNKNGEKFVIKSLKTFCKERNLCLDALCKAGEQNRFVKFGRSEGWMAQKLDKEENKGIVDKKFMLNLIKSKSFSNGTVHLLKTEDGFPLEVTDTFLPFYTKNAIGRKQNCLDNYNLGDRTERWMVGVSTMSGCPVRCKFCATAKLKKIKLLSAEEITEQVQFIVRKQLNTPFQAKEFKINYTRLGEPFLNIKEVVKAIDLIDKEYSYKDFKPHHYISTIGIKGSDFSWIKDNVTLQISLHSLDESRRNDLIPYKNKMTIEELGQIRTNSNLKTTVNLTLVDEADFDINKLKKYFDPKYFFIKLSPINPNSISKKNNLGDGIIQSKNLV